VNGIRFLDVGLRLESCMKARGLKKADLSRETGIPAPTIGRYIKGEMRPSGDNLLTVTQYFGVTQEWLYTGQGKDLVNDPSAEYKKSKIKTKAVDDPEDMRDQRAEAG